MKTSKTWNAPVLQSLDVSSTLSGGDLNQTECYLTAAASASNGEICRKIPGGEGRS